VRLPDRPEVFTREIHGVLTPYAGTQARHYLSTDLDFMFSKTFGLTMKYEYGALPPAFIFLDSRASIGFTFQYASH
jgi:hypothetical protein